MDAVIAYVNSNDPVWQKRYAETVGGDILLRRFYDWGTLKYVLRGIDRFIPFVNNVFLIVADEYQIPEYIDTDEVRVICHRDFIPEEYLPCFNCNTIEMYMHRIPGLNEQFIYFNDDMIPMNPMSPEDFFENGMPCIHIDFDDIPNMNQFQLITRQSETMAMMALGRNPENVHFSMRSLHTLAPFLVSRNEECLQKLEGLIEGSITTTRSSINVNQYLFTDYYYYSGLYKEKPLSLYYTNSRDTQLEEILGFIEAPTAKTMCLNDYDEYKGHSREDGVALLTGAFEKYFPFRSKYEAGAFDVVINHDTSREYKVMDFGLFEKQIELINRNLCGVRKIFVLCHNETDVPAMAMNVIPVEGETIVPERYQPFTNLDFAEYFIPKIPGLMGCFIFMKENVFINKPLSFGNFFHGLEKYPKIEFVNINMKGVERSPDFEYHEKWDVACMLTEHPLSAGYVFPKIKNDSVVPCNKKFIINYLSDIEKNHLRPSERHFRRQSNLSLFSIYGNILHIIGKTSGGAPNIITYQTDIPLENFSTDADVISIMRTSCFRKDFLNYKEELRKYLYD